MRDAAACIDEQGARRSGGAAAAGGGGRSVVEAHLRRGILLVKIWQEVLRVKFEGEKKDLFGRLDEFKREMWLLLVAAGSGYLARCWHKTLKPRPHSQLADHAYEDPDERPGSPNYSSAHLIDSSSPNGMRYASHGHHVSPRGSGRSFSSKGLSKKLFSEGAQAQSKTPQKDKEGEPNGGPDDSRRLVGGVIDKSLDARSESRRSPWSSFKVKKKQGSADDAERESSAGCLKRTGDKFRWVRERRKSSSDNDSSSSRSLQALLAEGDETTASVAGSSSRGFASAAQSKSQSIDLDRSFTGPFVIEGKDAPQPPQVSEELLIRGIVREKVSQFEQGKASSSSISKGSPDAKSTSSSASKEDSSSSGAKEDKGNLSLKAETVNAVLSLRAANLAQAQAQAQAQAHALEREKLRNLKLDSITSTSQDEEDVLSGGKGKRRTDVRKYPGSGEAALLPALLSGKRTKDSNKPMSRDSSEVTLTSLTGKRMKDREIADEDNEDQAESSLASMFGPIDLSQVFFGFDSMFFGSPKDDKSPARGSKRSKYMSRSGNRNLRRMRESPKPVSAIESCLRAQQFRDESPHVARTLNFSSYGGGGEVSPSFGQSDESHSPSTPSKMVEFGERKGKNAEFEDGMQPDELKGVIGLPLLRTPRRKGPSSHRKDAQSYKGGLELVLAESNFPRTVISEETERIYPSQSKLNDVVWRRTSLPVSLKKRKVSQAVTPSSIPADTTGNAYEFEALVIPPMEGLLFSFGVGIGVMSIMESSESEIDRLGRLLQESEERIEHLNDLLRESRQITADFGGLSSQQLLLAGSISSDGRVFVEVGNNKPPRNVLALVPVIDETGRERTDLFRREAPETPQQLEHMAELEAELEAELGLLTAGISEDFNGTPDFDELDPEGVAGVADRDLVVEGLPAVLDWDDDNDDFVPADVPNHSGGGVPPRELARLLRKVKNSRQEHQIHELEADLIEAEERLEKMEKELQELKQRIGSAAPSITGKFKSVYLF
ncbi:hypothetical protein AXG93_1112s1160 [Marchantia polymorpha subsp. ruderalis]|uniref:Uncharacterized protein n=1 Tax=Marchantia polymorpha subsp. ruderalis TaxID=1480154 RepID=A0A176WAN0_MARPO|nr:hypothetical protein AXG93_1112s1160 [Marchantia polymorpha subsp. ruderalis]